jgi:hypothetical protein
VSHPRTTQPTAVSHPRTTHPTSQYYILEDMNPTTHCMYVHRL